MSLLFDGLNGGVSRLEQQSLAFRGVGLVFLPLYFAPVDVACMLGHGHMRNQRTVAHQYNGWNLSCLNVVIAAFVDLTRLIVNSFALRQIAGAAVTALQ